MPKKNTITTILLLLLTYSISSQNNTAKAQEFLERINADQLITEHYDKYKIKIGSVTEVLFADFDLDINDSLSLATYNAGIDKSFTFFIKDAKQQILQIYANYDTERLERYIAMVGETDDKDQLYTDTNFATTVDAIIKKHSQDLKNDVRIILKEVKALNTPLRLRLIIDTDTIQDLETVAINLAVVNRTAPDKPIPILNTASGEISLPDDLEYHDVAHVVITYNQKQYPFFEDHYNRLTKELRAVLSNEDKELHNPLSQYCFEKLLFWEVHIAHTPENHPDYDLNRDPDKATKGMISFKTRTKQIGSLD